MQMFSKLPSQKRWLFWIIFAIVVKSLFFIYALPHEDTSLQDTPYNKTFAVTTVETPSYLEPAENFINTGHYDAKKWGDLRPPGYAWPYCLLRSFLSITWTLNVLDLIQLLLSAISVFALARVAYLIFKKESYFYLTFFLYLITIVVSLYDCKLESESFSTSALIFSIYFLLRSNTAKSCLIPAGLFITWCIFLKPIMGPLLALYAVYILVRNSDTTFDIFKFNWKSTIIFLIPFLIIDGAWMARNFNMYKKIIPLTKSVYFPFYEKGYRHEVSAFLSSYGGSKNVEEPTAGIRFFAQLKPKPTLPSYIYTSKFNYDSLMIVRDLIIDIRARDTETNAEIRNREEIIADRKLSTYTQSIKDEKPLLFYVFSRFNLFKSYLLHSGTHSLVIKSTSGIARKMEVGFKAFSSLLYIVILIGGFVGSLLLLLKGTRNIDYFLVAPIGLYFALIYPFIFTTDEFRYFLPGYPFFLLSCVYVLIGISNKIIKKANA